MHAAHRRAALRGIAAALGGIAGCGVLPPSELRAPELSLSGVSIESLDFERARFALVVDAFNPNAVDLRLRELRYELRLLDVPLAKGGSAREEELLPAGSTSALALTLDVPAARLLDVLRRIPAADWRAVPYRVDGSARWGRTPFTRTFERAGVIDVPRAILRGLPRG